MSKQKSSGKIPISLFKIGKVDELVFQFTVTSRAKKEYKVSEQDAVRLFHELLHDGFLAFDRKIGSMPGVDAYKVLKHGNLDFYTS